MYPWFILELYSAVPCRVARGRRRAIRLWPAVTLLERTRKRRDVWFVTAPVWLLIVSAVGVAVDHVGVPASVRAHRDGLGRACGSAPRAGAAASRRYRWYSAWLASFLLAVVVGRECVASCCRLAALAARVPAPASAAAEAVLPVTNFNTRQEVVGQHRRLPFVSAATPLSPLLHTRSLGLNRSARMYRRLIYRTGQPSPPAPLPQTGEGSKTMTRYPRPVPRFGPPSPALRKKGLGDEGVPHPCYHPPQNFGALVGSDA